MANQDFLLMASGILINIFMVIFNGQLPIKGDKIHGPLIIYAH